MPSSHLVSPFFFFNDTATTEIYTLSLHDALPIFVSCRPVSWATLSLVPTPSVQETSTGSSYLRANRPPAKSSLNRPAKRSEEHTSELQSLRHLVCRLLLEKKKKTCHSDKIMTSST